MHPTLTQLGAHYINPLIESLTAPVEKHIENLKKDLIEQNQRLGGPEDGFLFRGTFWTTIPKNMQYLAEKRMLHSSLHDDGTHLFERTEQLKKDRLYMIQALGILLRKCSTNQEIRDALPDVVMNYLPSEIASLDRKMSAGWPMKGTLASREFEKLDKTLTTYVASKLLY